MSWTKNFKRSEVLKKYKELSIERGHPLKTKEVAESDDLPSMYFFLEKLGGLKNVRQRLGLTKDNNLTERMFCNDCAKKKRMQKKLENCDYYDQADLYFKAVR